MTVADPRLELRVRTLRGQGVDPERRYFFPVTGYNFRLTNLAAALLCAQFERSEAILERRRELYTRYENLLDNVPGIDFQPVAEWAEVAPWLFCITVDEAVYGRTRDDLIDHLAVNGVDSRPFFHPVHRLPPFREESTRRQEQLPVTDILGDRGMNLPTYAALGANEQEQIAYLIRELAQ